MIDPKRKYFDFILGKSILLELGNVCLLYTWDICMYIYFLKSIYMWFFFPQNSFIERILLSVSIRMIIIIKKSNSEPKSNCERPLALLSFLCTVPNFQPIDVVIFSSFFFFFNSNTNEKNEFWIWIPPRMGNPQLLRMGCASASPPFSQIISYWYLI